MNKTQIMQLRVIGIFVVLLGIGLGIGSAFVGGEKLRIQETGVEVVAKVIEATASTDGDAHRYDVVLFYTTTEKQDITQRLQVPENVFLYADKAKELKIKYSTEDPMSVVFVDFPYSVTERYLIAVVLVLIGIGLSVWAFRAKPAA